MDNTPVSSKLKWKEFYQRYYKEDLQKLAVSPGRTKSLFIEFNYIIRFDVRLAEEILLNPGKVHRDAEKAIDLVDLPLKKKISAHVRIVKIPYKVLVRDLRMDHVNTLVSVDCTIRTISSVTARIVVAAFECARCGNIHYIPQEGTGRFLEPSYCQCNEEKKGVFRLMYKESTFEDYQRVVVQESMEDVDGGSEAQTLVCNLNNDLVGELNPGDRVIMNGIFRSMQKTNKDGKQTHFTYYLDVIGYERDEEDLNELEITMDDETKIREYVNDLKVFDKLAESVAPAICGYPHVKKAIVLQWFGGVVKRLSDGTRIRGDIHVLWLGDPSMGKSQVMEAAAIKAPRGMSTGGQGVSAAGLTAATVKDEYSEGIVLEAGVLVLASPGGHVYIDEFPRMRQDDRKKIHKAMEQQIVEVDRAGIHARMRAECSIFATGNPENGRWDPDEELAKQIDLDPAIISRFDLIFFDQDKPDESKDLVISGRILNAHFHPENIEPPIDPLLIKKWIALARRKVKPEPTKEVVHMLQEYYVEKRMESKDSTIKITARDLDGLIRLCTAHAKMRLSGTIEKEDVDAILVLKSESVRQTSTNSDGVVDVDNIEVGLTKTHRSRAQHIRNAVRDIAGGRMNMLVDVLSVIELCHGDGITDIQVRDEIEYQAKIGKMWLTEDLQKVMLI